MGLGRTTLFAPLPRGARRISVMRTGTVGLKALAPSSRLLAAFQAEKQRLVRAGRDHHVAHAEAAVVTDYRRRFLAEIRGRSAALAALRQILAEAKTRDVYLMCMCPYRTRARACHTYLLLDLARELDPSVKRLPEPAPRATRPRA